MTAYHNILVTILMVAAICFVCTGGYWLIAGLTVTMLIGIVLKHAWHRDGLDGVDITGPFFDYFRS